MPLLRPLRALRYGHDRLDHLDQLVSPATQGEPEDRRTMGTVHPECIRQLVRGERGPLARDDEPLFTHSARLLERWKVNGVLVRDPRPAFYIYEQDDGENARRGLVCLMRLNPWSEGPVLRHEETRGHVSEVLQAQLAATRTQLSMGMAVIADSGQHLQSYLDSKPGEPLFWARDGGGLVNRIYRDERPQEHLRLVEALRDEIAVIADGHHRYEAALRHQEQSGTPGARRDRPADYTMTMVLPATAPGLSCSPAHRVFPHLSEAAEPIVAALAAKARSFESDEALLAFLDEPGGTRVGMVLRGTPMGLLLDPTSGELPEPLARIDSAVLQQQVIEPLEAALGPEAGNVQHLGASGAGFSHNQVGARDLLGRAVAGELDLALLLRPVSVPDLLDVARAGLTVPPKSTNFSPKPTKGLLLNSLVSF